MILAKLIPFFICILLGTYQAVAQVLLYTLQTVEPTILNLAFLLPWISKLDFGTYEIISRASRSRLCSHEAGEQIYVSALWSSCAGGLVGIKGICIGLNIICFQVGIGSGRRSRFVYNQKHRPQLIRSSKQDVGGSFSFSSLFELAVLIVWMSRVLL